MSRRCSAELKFGELKWKRARSLGNHIKGWAKQTMNWRRNNVALVETRLTSFCVDLARTCSNQLHCCVRFWSVLRETTQRTYFRLSTACSVKWKCCACDAGFIGSALWSLTAFCVTHPSRGRLLMLSSWVSFRTLSTFYRFLYIDRVIRSHVKIIPRFFAFYTDLITLLQLSQEMWCVAYRGHKLIFKNNWKVID